jgi:hypothetical protein
MIKTLRLQNFRCFSDHLIEFEKVSVVVGKNNAGKTTLSEALRLISIVSERYRSLNYKTPPTWLNLPLRYYGCSPSMQGLQINFDTIFNSYGDPPALITAIFNNGTKIQIYLGGEDKIFSVIEDTKGNIIRSKAQALNLKTPQVSIMPQVAPLVKIEKIRDPEYIRGAMSSSLAPLHFRNQLYQNRTLWSEFKKVVEETWPGLQLKELIKYGKLGDEVLALNVRDRDFVAEVGIMGHGLQIWMQTIWFLIRAKRSSTAILDEPDVYMHADLQRQLIRLLRDRFPQVILTTHSTEIMAEVEPSEIILIDRNRKKSSQVNTLPGVQQVIEGFGSIHNILLTRLWGAKKFLLVEGKDIRLLKHLQNILFPKSEYPLDSVPNMSIGGWGGWSYAIGSTLFLKNSAGEEIRVLCLLDSDYHTPYQLSERIKEAREKGIHLHIWSMKEIENYLLVPTAILRCLLSGKSSATRVPTLNQVQNKMEEIALDLKDIAFDGFAQEFLVHDRSLGISGANKKARDYLDEKTRLYGLTSIISGKTMISKLSAWTQKEWGMSLSSTLLTRSLNPNEISNEVIEILMFIENGANSKAGGWPRER